MALKTETNTAAMERRVVSAAQDHPETWTHGLWDASFEHGQWWVTCGSCGAQWSVCDATGGQSVDGFDFERVSEGDEEEHSHA